MNVSEALKAASRFGQGEPVVEAFGTGLINHSFFVTYPNGKKLLLQRLNKTTFSQPENIINNYVTITEHLDAFGGYHLPRLESTTKGKHFWVDESDHFWRATAFVENSYAETVASSSTAAFRAAKCFASFSASLRQLDPEKLDIIIPHFHDLDYRYNQFEETIKKAGINRLLKATHVIASLREHYSLVEFYNSVISDPVNYPVRIMHHDCKISNILFDKTTGEVICPVDLDTVMPGRFFSDIGDLIRTMACSRDENSTEWEHIAIVQDYYQSIIDGYVEGSELTLTRAELDNIHMPGKMLIYMQCLRFVTDFLNNDVYYKTTYPEQNLNRALNQLLLLERC
ncbi:MAG: phosphotransferase [Flavitalea sp.]